MSRCCVRACPYFKKRPGVDNTGFRCYRFPEVPELRQKWIDWVNRANIAGVIKISKHAGVCSAHFQPEDFSPMSKKLKSNVIPSIAPEMTPEMAFKLGVARSAEDFIRSKQIKEEIALYAGSQEEIIIPDISTVNWVQEHSDEREVAPSLADTSTILVQAYSQYTEPELNLSAADPLTVPVQRVFVVPVVNVKDGHGTEIIEHDSSTDSCFSDPGENDSEKLKGRTPLILSAPSIISVPTKASSDIVNTKVISSIRAVCNSNTVTSSTDTNSSSSSLPIFASITAANSSGPFGIHTLGTNTLTTEISVDKSPVTSSFSTNVMPVAPIENTNTVGRGRESLSRQQCKRKSYVRDLSPSDFNTPEKCKKSLAFVHSKISSYQAKIKEMSRKLRRAQKKIRDLKSLVEGNNKT